MKSDFITGVSVVLAVALIVAIAMIEMLAQSSTSTGPAVPARWQVAHSEPINSPGPTNGLSFTYVIDSRPNSGNPCVLIIAGTLIQPTGTAVLMPTAAPCQAQ
jgi:hypothetical protein